MIAGGRRSVRLQAVFALVLVIVIAAACSKETAVPVDRGQELYIRIGQVDKDGETVQYSKVLKADIN